MSVFALRKGGITCCRSCFPVGWFTISPVLEAAILACCYLAWCWIWGWAWSYGAAALAAGLAVYGDELTALVGLWGVAHVVDELSANHNLVAFLQCHVAFLPLLATEVVDAEDVELGAVGIIGNIE